MESFTGTDRSNPRRPTRRALWLLARWYTGLALLFFNLVVFASILLLAGSIFLEATSKRQRAPIHSTKADLNSYSLIDRQTAVGVVSEHDEMGEAELFVFNPWTTFMEGPFQGQSVTVESRYLDNTRGTATPAQPQEGQKDLLVWTFGGSTMFGWFMPDSHTIASLLQEQLQAALPPYRVRVINHGHCYYTSSSELALYIALLRAEEQPDIVVFLNGINDRILMRLMGYEVPYFTYAAEAGWESQRQKRRQARSKWMTVHESFPPLRFVRYLQWKFGITPPAEEEKTRYPVAGPKETVRVLDTYRLNREMVLHISRRLGIDAYVFLQPAAWYSRESPEDEFYHSLVSEAGSHPQFFTLHDALWNVPQPFVDGLHYSDLGNLTLAQRMAQIIVPNAGKWKQESWQSKRPKQQP